MSLRKEMWQTKKIAEVCEEIFAGGDVPKDRLSKTPTEEFSIPIYSNGEKNKGLYGYTDVSRVQKASLTISARGTIGYTEVRERDFYPAVRLIVVTPNSDVLDLSFLKVVISNTNLASYGTSIPQLTVPMIKQYEIPVPPLDEQKQIASLFDSIDATLYQLEIQEENIKSLQKILINGLLEEKPHLGNLLSENNIVTIKFGGFADCVEQHDKEKRGLARFVGLENIESGDFKIGTWGNISNGTTFTKRFFTGDVLFGKRRSYLKKVAVADFDGICSGDILVFRAKEGKILPGLLPYYIASDAFIQHAVTTSAGSLSPRTKWKDLKEFAASIPDLQTQGKVLEVLNQFQTVLNQIKDQKGTLKTLKQNLLNEILG